MQLASKRDELCTVTGLTASDSDPRTLSVHVAMFQPAASGTADAKTAILLFEKQR